MRAVARVGAVLLAASAGRDRRVNGDSGGGVSYGQRMDYGRSNERTLRPRRANGCEVVRGRATLSGNHPAAMLTMAAAAGRKSAFGILCECERRRQGWKRDGREQQDGEQASHGTDDLSVGQG